MEPGSIALLVIDFQNEYRPGAAYPVEGYDAILGNAAALIDAARGAGVPLIHVQAWVEETDKQKYPLLHDSLAAEFRYGDAGTAGADFCREVAPAPAETVIRKNWPSAFRETALVSILKADGVSDLLVIGVWTDSCVRATVFDAVSAGFRVWLVKDACGSGTDTMHRTAILDMANRLYGGGVLRTSEATKALRGEPYAAWTCARPVEFQYTLGTIDSLYDRL